MTDGANSVNVARNARTGRIQDAADADPRTAAAKPAAPIPAPPLAVRGFRVGAYDTSPFEDATAFWRVAAQLATILMAVIIFGDGKATLSETAPGVSVDDVIAATGATLSVAGKVLEMQL